MVLPFLIKINSNRNNFLKCRQKNEKEKKQELLFLQDLVFLTNWVTMTTALACCSCLSYRHELLLKLTNNPGRWKIIWNTILIFNINHFFSSMASSKSIKSSVTFPCKAFENLQDLNSLNQQCDSLLEEVSKHRPSSSMFNFSLHTIKNPNPLKAPSSVRKYNLWKI